MDYDRHVRSRRAIPGGGLTDRPLPDLEDPLDCPMRSAIWWCVDEVARLLAAARDSRLVIFAGAGVSMGAPTNLPSWRDVNRIVVRSLASAAAPILGAPLATRATELVLARHAQEKLPPEYQAQVLAELLHGSYFEVLRHLDSDRPNATHLAIAWLAQLGCVRAVITTNFDRVLEAAFAAVGAPCERCFKPEHFRALAGDLAPLDRRGGPCQLLKLHGSVDDPATLIDTLSQRKKGFAGPLMDCVRHLLRTNHWLFLGFSGLDLEADHNYLALAQEAERAMGFSWFVRAGTKPQPAVVRLVGHYEGRGALVEGNLPDWLHAFIAPLSPAPRAWIDAHLASTAVADAGGNTRALEAGATAWAAGLSTHISAMAIAHLVLACAEPHAAAELVERVLSAIEPTTKAEAGPSHRALLVKAMAANSLGILLAGMGRHGDALTWLTTAIDLAQAVGDDDTRDRFRGNRAVSLEALGRVDEARAEYESALAGYRARGDPVLLAFGLTCLASHLIRHMRLDEARGITEEAMQWATKAGDERMRGTALNDLGMIAKLQSDLPAALKIFEDVESLFTRLGNDAAVAAAAGNRGEVLAALGQFDEAERIQHSVMQINTRLDAHENRAATCLSLGVLERLRGNSEAEGRWFSMARDISREIGDPANEGFALLRMAQHRAAGQHFEESLALAESALPLVEGRNAPFTSDLWAQIGLASLRLGRLDHAEVAYRRVCDFNRGIGSSRALAAATMNLGTILLVQRRDDGAATHFAESAGLWAQLGERESLEYCRLGEAAVRLDQKIGALSDALRTAQDPQEKHAAAFQMVSLYPELISMYEKIGASQRVADLCASAAGMAAFAGADEQAAGWYRRAAEVYSHLGLGPQARENLEQCEDRLRLWTNELIERQAMAEALPGLLQYVEVAGQLGHHGHQASAALNAAIVLVRVAQDFTGARTLAGQALDLLPADSDDVSVARQVITYCDERLRSG